jgi:hypothetical protein
MPPAATADALHRVPAICRGMARGETSEAFTSHAPQEFFAVVGARLSYLGG